MCLCLSFVQAEEAMAEVEAEAEAAQEREREMLNQKDSSTGGATEGASSSPRAVYAADLFAASGSARQARGFATSRDTCGGPASLSIWKPPSYDKQ